MEAYQQLLFPYAYNILGSVEDAKDVVQEVVSKYYTTSREGVNDEKNYLIRSVINLAINTKNRNKRVSAATPEWLPEPVATDDNADKNINMKDILSYSLMVLMERLSTMERTVFILRESFDYDHKEIAAVLSISEEYSRKLLSRAKTRLFKPGPAVRTAAQQQQTSRLLADYIDAIRQGDVKRLESMLYSEVTMVADGGQLKVVRKITEGVTDVLEILQIIYTRYLSKAEVTFRWVNHQPAFVYTYKGRVVTCQIFDVSEDGNTILRINNVVDPNKLKQFVIE